MGGFNTAVSNDQEEGEIAIAPSASHSSTMNSAAIANTHHSSSTSSNGGGGGGSGGHRSSFGSTHGRSSWGGNSNSNTGHVGYPLSNTHTPPKTSSTPFKPPKPVNLGSYASLSEAAEKREHGRERDPSTPGVNVPNWEPPRKQRPSFQNRNAPSGHGAHHSPPGFAERRRPFAGSDRDRDGYKINKSPPVGPGWRDRDTHREGPRDRERDVNKPWEKPRFEHPYQKRNTSRSSWGEGVGVGANAVGAGAPGGSYYGPTKVGSGEDAPGDYYGQRERDGSTGVGAIGAPGSVKKYSAGPRFQPPPGTEQNHFPMGSGNDDDMTTMGGANVNVNVNINREEEEMDFQRHHSDTRVEGILSAGRNNSPSSKMRLDGGLSTGRSQSHAPSPFSSPEKKQFPEARWKQPSSSGNLHGSGSGGAGMGGLERQEKPFIRKQSTSSFGLPPPPDEDDLEAGQITSLDLKAEESQETNSIVSASFGENKALEKKERIAEVSSSLKSMSTHLEVETPTPTPVLQVTRLTCSAFRDKDGQKAIKVIKILSELVDDESLKEIDVSKPVDSVPLPAAEQVTKAVQDLQSHSKQAQQQLKLIKFKMRQAVEKDMLKKKQQDQEAKEEQEAKEKEAEMHESVQNAKLERMKVVLEKEEAERSDAKKRLLDEISQAKKSVEELDKMIEERKETNKATSALAAIGGHSFLMISKYESIIVDAQRASQEAKVGVNLAAEVRTDVDQKLQTAEKDLEKGPIGKLALQTVAGINSAGPVEVDVNAVAVEPEVSDRLSSILESTIDDSQDMRRLVLSIMRENKQRAAQAHHVSISIVVSEAAMSASDSTSPPGLVSERDDDKSFEPYIAYWTKRTQDVTGPGDALYSEPSQVPLYKNTQKHHEEMRLLVREHVRDKKRKLHHRWTELAQEYAVREQLYEKNSNRDSNSIHSTEIGGSFSICGQRRGGGGAATNSSSFGGTEVGSGSRATNNPYRRARRSAGAGAGFQAGSGDIVRSDYEQDQIIAQLTAQENMEKRIKLGGSELPRQVCRVEKVRQYYIFYHCSSVSTAGSNLPSVIFTGPHCFV